MNTIARITAATIHPRLRSISGICSSLLGMSGPRSTVHIHADSAQFRFVRGQLQRSQKPQQLRGLNQNHNHETKEIFKSTATRANWCTGPFRDFYEALLAKGMKPEMARLMLARKIAAITLTLWKKEERFDAEQLKTQAA